LDIFETTTVEIVTLILVLVPVYILKALLFYYALRWILKWRRERNGKK